MRKLSDNLKALANERRIKILKILLKEKELTVSAIAEKINLSHKSTSKHLLLLEKNGFLKYKNASIYTFYSIKPRKELHNDLLGIIKKYK